jgi:hypothetical protein
MLRHLKEAQQRKDQVLQAVAAMELPNNPLDSLIDLLGGTSAVAEMTGALTRSSAGRGDVVLMKQYRRVSMLS